MRTRLKILPILIAAAVILFQYLSSEKVTNPETGQSARVGLSTQQEASLGLQSYRQVLAQSAVVESGPQFDQVTRVAKRLIPVTGDAARKFDWSVSVVQSRDQNAFCLPGGKIVVYTGILPITQNDAGLATVLGHEMAHATLRHGAQRVFQQNVTQTALQGAAYSISDMDYNQQRTIMGLLGAGAQFGVILPFGRGHESEADQLGVIYMARAGYDPRESITFWQRMAEAGGRQSPEFLSTHPNHGTRIQRLKEHMPKALEEFEKAPKAP